MKKTLLIISFIVLPFFAFAETSNVGIIKGIWFSDSQFFDGDTIRIYTAVQNNSGDDTSGSIEFFDNRKSLGSKNFSALNNRIIESWMDTVAVSGEHEFSVRITQLKKGDTNITAQEIFSERIKVVKIDTDGDGISDDIDDDDDGDGVLDIDEVEAGSDPLDDKSIPVEEESNTITTIINNIFNSDSSEVEGNLITHNYDSNINKENTKSTDNDLLEQSPSFAKDIAKNNELIKTLILHISKLQNDAKSIIKHEKIKLNEKEHIEKKITRNGKVIKIEDGEFINDTKKNSESNNQEKLLHGVLLFIYKIILDVFAWLFSIWWFVVILLFLIIYLVLKLLFRIFGKVND